MQESKRISISSFLAVAFSLLMAAWGLIVLVLERSWVIPLADYCFAASFALIPWLSRKGWTRLARNLLVTLVNGTIFLFPALFGEAPGTHYCFLPATTLPFALFETRQRASLAYGVVLPMALFAL